MILFLWKKLKIRIIKKKETDLFWKVYWKKTQFSVNWRFQANCIFILNTKSIWPIFMINNIEFK